MKSFAICRSIDVRKCRTASLSFWFWFSLKFRMSRSDSLSHPYLLRSFGTFLPPSSFTNIILLHQSPHRNPITDSTFIVELFFDSLQVAEMNKQTQVAGQNREKENKDTTSRSGYNAYTNTDEVQNHAPM